MSKEQESTGASELRDKKHISIEIPSTAMTHWHDRMSDYARWKLRRHPMDEEEAKKVGREAATPTFVWGILIFVFGILPQEIGSLCPAPNDFFPYTTVVGLILCCFVCPFVGGRAEEQHIQNQYREDRRSLGYKGADLFP